MMILDLENLGSLLLKVVIADDLYCGSVREDVKDDLEKCFKMFRVMALYINEKINKLNTPEEAVAALSVKEAETAKDQVVESQQVTARYYCQICDRNFVTEDSLESHKSYLHGIPINNTVANNEQEDKSGSYEVVVEQIYENWSARPNDGQNELVVKDVTTENTVEIFENIDREKNEYPDANGFNPDDSLLVKRSRGRPRKGSFPTPRDPNKIIKFNPKWINPNKWVKFVDNNGDRMCWYIQEVVGKSHMAYCKVCEVEIKIDNSGVNGIKIHAATKKHKKKIEHVRDSFNPGYKRSWFS